MAKHLPEWIMKRYSKLWNKFKGKEFTKSKAEKVSGGDSSLPVLLSELRKAGWLEMKIGVEDARKTIYKLKNPEKAINEIIKDFSK